MFYLKVDELKKIDIVNNLNIESFFIYYGSAACTKKLNQYETIILDPDNYKNVKEFKAFTYAYLSLGEVNHFRDYFKVLELNEKLLKKCSIWDSYLIKFDNFWENLVLTQIIPSIIKSGYKGIMLDTIDSILHHKLTSRNSIIELINKIKAMYPDLNVMVNRGFEIINELNIDSVLLESTISTHDFETSKYFLHEETHRFDIKESIKCYSVDYWYTEDNNMISQIKSLAVNRGYVPLVTDIKLQKLP